MTADLLPYYYLISRLPSLVDHRILLHRLEIHFGIRGSALSWFQSYLRDRHQYVSVRGQTSSCYPLPSWRATGVSSWAHPLSFVHLTLGEHCEETWHVIPFLCGLFANIHFV